MARYIDADKAHEEIEKLQTDLESNDDRLWKKNKPYYKGLAMARGIINNITTADVVPKSEVERLNQKLDKAENMNMALCMEQVECDEMTIYILEHYAKTKIKKFFEEIELAVFSYGMGIRGELVCETMIIDKDLFGELKNKYTEGI